MLVALAVGLGAIVFAHRMDTTPDGIVLYGEYDTADLTYYAGEASEASHTIPPMAFYYSGHNLNAAYFPHLVLAMIHRFAAVPVLSIYFRYAWPTFLVLSALTGFVLVRSLASTAVAALAVALVIVASDFSYLAAWFLPQCANSGAWDYVLWPTNFFSPTMQMLHFSTWGLSLPLFFTALFTIVRGLQTRARGWIVVSAFLLGDPVRIQALRLCGPDGRARRGRRVFRARRLARWHFVATAGSASCSRFRFCSRPPRRSRRSPDAARRRIPSAREADADQARARRDVSRLGGLDRAVGAAADPGRSDAGDVVFLAIGIGVRWVGDAGRVARDPAARRRR